MRTLIAAAVTCSLLVGLARAADVAASIKQPVSIPSQDLASALKEFARERKIYLVFMDSDLGTRKTPGLVGEFSQDEALRKLLEGSGLTFHYIDDKTISIVPIATAPPRAALPDRFRIARATEDSPQAARFTEPQQEQPRESVPAVLEEVTVSAQKRDERLQEVPIPVTVLNGAALAQSNQLRLQDYYSKVPGLNLGVPGQFGDARLTLRGIPPSANAAPSVGILIDDVPYGSPVGLTTRGQPDVDPGDLERVEVLRGPQGTLYGVSSMGGLLKFVTVDPSTEAFGGRLQAGTDSFFNGVGPGYNFRGSINVPVSETVAIRAGAFRTQDTGYTENIVTGQRGVNRRTSDGGRLALLWKPSEALSLKLSALLQNSRRDGADVSVVGPGFADLQQQSLPNTQTTQSRIQAYSATLKARFAGLELTSLTGFNLDHFEGNHDTTYVLPIGGGESFWDSLANSYLHTTGHGSVVLDWPTNRNFSQELRLSIPLGSRVTW